MTDLIQGLLACLQRGWWGVGAWGGGHQALKMTY